MIVNGRSDTLVEMMVGKENLHCLLPLTDEDCWAILKNATGVDLELNPQVFLYEISKNARESWGNDDKNETRRNACWLRSWLQARLAWPATMGLKKQRRKKNKNKNK